MSTLVFLETLFISIPLSKEEKLKVLIGSKEERQRILNSLSPEDRQTVIGEREFLNRTATANSPGLIQKGDEGFEDLNEQAKEFLIAHGADIQGNYVDYAILIVQTNFFKFVFSLDLMELQVAEIAQAHNIRIKVLDNNSQIADDLEMEKKEDSDPFLITRDLIESSVNNHEQIVEKMRRFHLEMAELYVAGNAILPFVEFDVSPAFLKNRNALWMKKLKEAHENPEHKSLFVAAGLRHFVGSFNLIDQLKEEGFAVSRMICSSL